MMGLNHSPASVFFQNFDIHQCEISQIQTAKRIGVWAAILGSETGF
jgi:hypothetical protein